MRPSPFFNTLYNSLIILQYFCAAILLAIVVQMIWTSSYHLVLLISVILVNFVFATILLGLLGYKFISWYKINKNSAVLLYGATFAMISTSTGFASIVNSVVKLIEKPEETVGFLTSQPKSHISEKSSSVNHSSNTNEPNLVLLGITYTPMRIAFIMLWITTAILLRNYSNRLGRSKFWIIVTLPLVSYLFGSFYSDYIGITGQVHKTPLLTSTLLIVSAVTTGGILFGAAFLTTARSIPQIRKNTVGNYLTIAGYGIVLLAVSLTSPVAYTPYPPFSAVSWSFVALASYVFSLGFYASAISVSHDSELRKLLRESTIEEQARLLDSIGTAEMEQETVNRILDITNKQSEYMTEQTGIQASLSEQDAKEYLNEVLNEVKNLKQKKD